MPLVSKAPEIGSVLRAAVCAAAQRSLRLWWQEAARSQSLLEVFVLVLKDNLESTLIGM